ncbi:hypothetical protein GCM10022393_33730 [Aquimarina addita]|uniref:Ricin B lectin domain-containing protein n=1 Tax=Aquimarina addita TaxID=870485 RepID=A0ABP6UPL0_9FLAO
MLLANSLKLQFSFWRTKLSAFALFFMTIVSAQTSLELKSSIDRVQPMTGIVFWAENSGDLSTLGNKVQLEYSYLVYSDVVQNRGQYNWGVVDDLLSTAASRGRQVILRFRYTYPGVTSRSVPQYILNSSGYNNRTASVEGSNTFIPDWSSQELQDFTLEFFTNFAARYDNDPRLAFVQVGFGSYSEYHLYDGPFAFGDTFPTKAYQTTFLNHINSVFNNTQWTISIDAADSSTSPLAASASLRNLNFGLFDDSFLHSQHSQNNNEYNRASWLTFGATRANTKVAGGEFSYYSDYDQEHVLDLPNGPHGTSFEEMAALYDITYMIGNDQLSVGQSASRIEDAGMNIGYHFEVTSYTSNGNSTSVTIKNNGLAPIYYDAYPTVGGTRSGTSLKGLISGQSRNFTINDLPDGAGLSIESDRLVSGQEIQYDADLDGGTVVGGGDPIVTIQKRNATGYAIDGGNGGANRQDVYLWSYDPTNPNQQWVEIDRGNGYYSYQKQGTNYCIDGNRGGANKQNVYLWTCGENNYNQHWEKVSAGGGSYKLIKRNASGFTLDGGSGGKDGQTVQLWNSSVTHQNLNWIITPITEAKTAGELNSSKNADISVYPVPVTNELNINLDVYEDFLQLKIIDVTGKTIMEEASITSNKITLDTSTLSSGLYILKAFKADGNQQNMQFVK